MLFSYEDTPEIKYKLDKLHDFVIEAKQGKVKLESGITLEELVEALEVLGYGLAKLDPNHDEMAKCVCGHTYYRHFDPYERNREVGCKYCLCPEFNE